MHSGHGNDVDQVMVSQSTRERTTGRDRDKAEHELALLEGKHRSFVARKDQIQTRLAFLRKLSNSMGGLGSEGRDRERAALITETAELEQAMSANKVELVAMRNEVWLQSGQSPECSLLKMILLELKKLNSKK